MELHSSLEGREARWFFTTAGKRVKGYACPPNAGAWWCPTEGYTLWEDSSLFDTKLEGLRRGWEDAATVLEKAKKACLRAENLLREASR